MRNRSFIGNYDEGMNHQYYVVRREICSEAARDTYREEFCCEQMLLNNRIEGILPVRAEIRNNEKHYLFCTDGLRPLKAICGSGCLKGDFIGNLITGIISVVVEGAEYFLDENDYIIEPETIFVPSEGDRVYVVYVPGYDVDLRTQLLTLLETLMENLDYNDRRAAYITYSIYGKCKRDGITLDELWQEALKWSGSITDIDMELPSDKNSVSENVSENSQSDERAADDSLYRGRTQNNMFPNGGNAPDSRDVCDKNDYREKREFISALFSKAAKKIRHIIEGFGEGKSDNKAQEVFPAHSRPSLTGKGRTIILESLPFFVGRMKIQCDLCIDSDDVSRFHARIGKRDGAFYVVDLGSEKGTFLNGIMLEPGLEEPIMSGDELTFGNEGFLFDDGET